MTAPAATTAAAAAAAGERVMVSPVSDALIIVDMQNDFLLPEAPLLVPGGAPLACAISDVSSRLPFRCQVATQDWHPEGHCSFKEQGGPWPPHCRRGTHGAALHDGLGTEHIHAIVRKGTALGADSYSAFADDDKTQTGLAGLLHSLGIHRCFVCGVAYDYCVYFTAMDAKAAGFDVVVVSDLCAPVDAALAEARTQALQEAGITVVECSALEHGPRLA